jgi:hypothetical protein
MARNILTFTNRTFLTIYNELNTLYPDRPEWFKTIFAGLFDILHWYGDANAQNTLLPSAISEEALSDHTETLDYYRTNNSPAAGSVTVTPAAASLPFTLTYPDDTLFRISTQGGSTINYEYLSDITFTTADPVILPIYEGITRSDLTLGTSDGETQWPEFVIPDADVLTDTLSVRINSNTYDIKDTLADSFSSDKHCRLVKKTSGKTAIMFGDGEYGVIAEAGDVIVTYRRGGSIAGNIVAATSTIDYSGDTTLFDSISINENFTGGHPEESWEVARDLAPKLLKTNGRAVTEEDYEVLSKRYSSGIILVKAFPGLFGAGTIGIQVIPAGGGDATSAQRTALETYLIGRSTFSAADARVRVANYQSQDITMGVKMRGGVTYASREDYFKVSCILYTSETVTEMIDYFTSSGIEDVVTFLNSKFGFTFTSANYAQLSKMFTKRKEDSYTTWGKSFRPNDVITMNDLIDGVDYSEITSPTAVVPVDTLSILTSGTFSISEIV